jgi:predicted ATPase
MVRVSRPCYPLSHPAEFFLLDENGIKLVDYEETDHYRVTKSFLDNPARYFKVLFGK